MDIRDIYKNFLELEARYESKKPDANKNGIPDYAEDGKGKNDLKKKDEVVDEWDNSPDAEYKDDDFMTKDMGNDMHRKKHRKAIRVKDPAIEAQEELDSIKSKLREELDEKLGRSVCSECGKQSWRTLSNEEIEMIERDTLRGRGGRPIPQRTSQADRDARIAAAPGVPAGARGTTYDDWKDGEPEYVKNNPSRNSEPYKAWRKKMGQDAKRHWGQSESTTEAHGNDKIYDKCWKGYKKVPGKSRGEEGSCVKA